MCDKDKKLFVTNTAFTLIELLIVVLIIAILAAIAVPNFLEFQTRAKISRIKSDQRSAATAIEAYSVDNNEYPQSAIYAGETYYNSNFALQHPKGYRASIGGCILATTPISYITRWPQLTFPIMEKSWSASVLEEYRGRVDAPMHYKNVKRWADADNPQDSGSPGDLSVERDMGIAWLIYTPGPRGTSNNSSYGSGESWYYYPRNNGFPTFLKPYDPTNGTYSGGSIHRYGSGDRTDWRDLEYSH